MASYAQDNQVGENDAHVQRLDEQTHLAAESFIAARPLGGHQVNHGRPDLQANGLHDVWQDVPENNVPDAVQLPRAQRAGLEQQFFGHFLLGGAKDRLGQNRDEPEDDDGYEELKSGVGGNEEDGQHR